MSQMRKHRTFAEEMAKGQVDPKRKFASCEPCVDEEVVRSSCYLRDMCDLRHSARLKNVPRQGCEPRVGAAFSKG